ncbi:MAG TPA: 2-hydroxyacid dehydrogenase [Stellaceae bacterium]|nr:2-hydroxyacid dehydrogenase [Stellaceae bacterium]
MRAARPSLLVTFRLQAAERALVARALGSLAEAVYLTDLAPEARAEALRCAAVVLARNTARELQPGELQHIAKARLVQFVSAGVDFIPFKDFPPGVPVASNRGAYAEPMAEHALAMALAAAKRLFAEQAKMARGEFNQFAPNRMLAGKVCGVLGLGGIGTAVARLMHCIGMRVHAINRRAAAAGPVEWIGAPDRLDALLAAADVLIISTPLTRSTRRLIGAAQLALMKSDAILINLARGEIIDEAALYRHLVSQPNFTACIDAWWVEPVRHGTFRTEQPFLDLANVIASPHNSASAEGWREVALGRALENCARVLRGEAPLHVIADEERMS